MNLKDRLNADLVSALKNHDAETASVLRMLKSALKNSEISMGHELSEIEALATLEKQVKQRLDSKLQYENGGRPELAQKEALEAEMIGKYLPEKLTQAELTILVEKTIQESGATSIKDMGNVMKLVSSEAAGRADGRTLSDIVKAKLS